MTIKYSKKASSDLEAIWQYTHERWSKEPNHHKITTIRVLHEEMALNRKLR
jgi:plasmid stabilization system protein ParE